MAAPFFVEGAIGPAESGQDRKPAFTDAGYLALMSFRKPFKAVPIKLSPAYQRRRREEARGKALRLLVGAGVVGMVTGIGSIALSADGRSEMVGAIKPYAVKYGLVRARAPQAGDVWFDCDHARAAGTAPIYSDEPGYRWSLDGDGDGIACEPYRPAIVHN